MTTIHYNQSMFLRCLLIFILSIGQALANDQSPVTIQAQGGTGYKINGIRTFETNNQTQFYEDGVPVPLTRAQGGTGYKIRYRVVDTAPDLLSGTISEANLVNVIKGPVVSLSPFRVFDMDHLITGKTYWADALSPGQLKLGDAVKISGYVDSESLVLVTRIERVDALPEWRLSGVVSAVSTNDFRLGEQLVNYQSGDLVDCDGPLVSGQFVRVRALPIADFQQGDVLNSQLQVKCTDRRVLPTNDGLVIIDGMIDEVEPNKGFFIAGQLIELDSQTRFFRGKAVDLQERIRVVVEGNADVNSGDVLAQRVRFLDPRFDLILPVNPNDQIDQQFQLAGIVLTATTQTLDPDDVLSGLTSPSQVQFRGYDLGEGEVYITRLRVIGAVNYSDVGIFSEVTTVSQPILDMIGVTIDTTNASFTGMEDEPLTAAEFFAQVISGAAVQVTSGAFDEITGVISGGHIRLHSVPPEGPEQTNNFFAQGGTGVRGIGTISATPDVIFVGSFEVP